MCSLYLHREPQKSKQKTWVHSFWDSVLERRSESLGKHWHEVQYFWESIQLTSEVWVWLCFLLTWEKEELPQINLVPVRTMWFSIFQSRGYSSFRRSHHTLYRTLRSPITLPWECTCSLGLFPLTDTIVCTSVGMTTSQISSVDKSWVQKYSD